MFIYSFTRQDKNVSWSIQSHKQRINTMKTSYKAIIAAGAVLPFIGMANVLAHAAPSTTDTSRDSLITKLSNRFSLNKSDVQSVFDEEHAARESQMKAKMSDALKAAGLTDSQISALQTKQIEQRAAHDAWEEKAQRDAGRADFEVWAKDQDIDLTKVQSALRGLGRGHGMMHRGGHLGGPGMMSDNDKEMPDDNTSKIN
jgi:hypothetical protein